MDTFNLRKFLKENKLKEDNGIPDSDVDQHQILRHIYVILQDEIPEHVDVYIDSVKRDFVRGDIQQYVDFTDDDIYEDFDNYIADKMSG